MICRIKAIGSGSYMVGNGGSIVLKMPGPRTTGTLLVLGESSVLWPPKKRKRLGCSSQTGSSPSINSMNRNCMSREAGTVVHTRGMLLGSLVCVCV